jgi:hypothetical protein
MKLVLNDISNLTGNPTSAEQSINSNFELIEAAIENTLSRDGTSPNYLDAALDANSQRIVNLPFALTASEPVTLAQVMKLVTGEDWTGGVGIPAVVYYQPTVPTATASGQVWVNTSDLTMWIWDGSAWVYIRDPNIDVALELANGNYTSITDLSGRMISVEDDTADISTALIAVQNDVGSLAASITTITADVDNVEASIVTEAIARVSGDNALATAINALQVSNALIYVQASAPVPGVSGVPNPIPSGSFWYDSDDGNKAYRYVSGAWLNVTDSDITALQAAVTAETAARISADSAIAVDITNIYAQRNGDVATVTTNNTASVDRDAVIAANVTALTASLANTNATIVTNNNVRITEDELLASQLSSTNTTVDGLSTTVEVHSASINGIEGKYSVKIDANGYITGFGLLSTLNGATPTSIFTVLADNFQIVTPGVTPVKPFYVSGGITYIRNVIIDEASIGTATIGTLNIKGDAVSNITTATFDFRGTYGPTAGAGVYNNLTTAWGTCQIAVLGMVLPGSKVTIRSYLNVKRAGSSGETIVMRMRRNDGVYLPGTPTVHLGGDVVVHAWEFVDTAPVWTDHTYTVQVARSSGTGYTGTWYDLQLVATVFKR